MRHRPLLVALTPNPRCIRLRTPLYGKSGKFLAEISGIPHNVLMDEFQRVNLLPEIHYGPLSSKEGKRNADELCNMEGFYDRDVFLLGRFVARSFSNSLQLYEPEYRQNGTITYIPHPSGLCRTWNDHGVRDRVGKMLREAHKRWKAANP